MIERVCKFLVLQQNRRTLNGGFSNLKGILNENQGEIGAGMNRDARIPGTSYELDPVRSA